MIRRLARAAIAIAAIGAVYFAVTFAQVWHAAHQSHVHDARAIVVMGAAQYDGRPSPVLQRRLDRALELYRAGRGRPIVTTGANQEGDRFTEGFAGYQYLREQGVPEDDLLVVTTGANSWESLAATAVELRRLGVRDPRVLVVSDPYHSYRLERIARETGLDPLTAPTGGSSPARALVRETIAVGLGRVIGFRRLSNLTT